MDERPAAVSSRASVKAQSYSDQVPGGDPIPDEPEMPPVLVARPAEVVDLRREQAELWRRAEMLGTALGMCAGDLHKAQEWLRWLHGSLDRAELWWVNPDMTSVLEATAKTMPDVHPDPPSETGFVVFARPVRGIDALLGSATMLTAAYLWAPAVVDEGPCVTLASFDHRDSPDPDVDPQEQRAYPAHLVVTGTNEWPTTAVTSDTSAVPLQSEEMARSLVEDRRLLAAFWAILDSPGVETDEAPLDRQVRRRSQRAGLLPAGVRIVLLRQPRHPDEPGEEITVAWSHRWMVSPHWRQQWYPKTRQHKAKLIMSYVKGPADKPLVIRETVRAVIK